MKKIRPLYDRIVVKRIEEQETIRSGIIIPDSAKEKPIERPARWQSQELRAAQKTSQIIPAQTDLRQKAENLVVGSSESA